MKGKSSELLGKVINKGTGFERIIPRVLAPRKVQKKYRRTSEDRGIGALPKRMAGKATPG